MRVQILRVLYTIYLLYSGIHQYQLRSCILFNPLFLTSICFFCTNVIECLPTLLLEMFSLGETQSFQSRKRLYNYKCPFVRLFVCLLPKPPNSLKSIIQHHHSHITSHTTSQTTSQTTSHTTSHTTSPHNTTHNITHNITHKITHKITTQHQKQLFHIQSPTQPCFWATFKLFSLFLSTSISFLSSSWSWSLPWPGGELVMVLPGLTCLVPG